jgi:hypothetical protein
MESKLWLNCHFGSRVNIALKKKKMCGLITRQLRTAIELYREAIRFTAKSKVQNSFYAAIQRECLDE